jgi:hypothetical protein
MPCEAKYAAALSPPKPLLAQPVGQADVIGVHVGHDDTQHRQTFQLVLEHLFPLRPGFVAGNAAVHHGPALAAVQRVAQQPEVDVVQRERQHHADPLHARCHFQRAAWLGQGVGQRVVQAAFELVFGGWGHAQGFR